MNTHTKPRASTTLIAPCDCQHHDWLTCLAREHHMSRFNASLVFATNTMVCNGRCECLCHQDEQGQQVSEAEWTARRYAVNPLAARPKNRNAYLNFHKHAEAKRRRGER